VDPDEIDLVHGGEEEDEKHRRAERRNEGGPD